MLSGLFSQLPTMTEIGIGFRDVDPAGMSWWSKPKNSRLIRAPDFNVTVTMSPTAGRKSSGLLDSR